MICQNCQKTEDLCVCNSIQPISTRLRVLILQHPQEPDKDLGTARITQLALPQAVLKVGLSWANLQKALGEEAKPSEWAVLYLGSGMKGKPVTGSALQFVSKAGIPVLPPDSLKGIVVLDGTWSQAKALWWRNPWLLKLRRTILNPTEKSLYKELRKEPRRECLSTLESVAATLVALGEPTQVKESLLTLFQTLLDKQRLRLKSRTKSV